MAVVRVVVEGLKGLGGGGGGGYQALNALAAFWFWTARVVATAAVNTGASKSKFQKFLFRNSTERHASLAWYQIKYSRRRTIFNLQFCAPFFPAFRI